MASEIQIHIPNWRIAPGYYCIVRNSVGQPCTLSGPSFGAYSTGSLGDYDLALTRQGTASSVWVADFPSVPRGTYRVDVYAYQTGGTPAESDEHMGEGSIAWSGAEVTSAAAVNVESITGSAEAAENLAAMFEATPIVGAVDDVSATATSFQGDSGMSSVDGFYLGCVLAFRDGALEGLGRKVTGYVGTTRTFSFNSAFPAAPADEDAFILTGRID